ncbi:MAG: division/cell wall cluster transcriptional repressor MraZ [Eubacteriales bacterium]
MFTGEYWYSMDQKGRVSIPPKLREGLGEEFKITKGFDKCLCVYPLDEWTSFANKIKELPEARQRHARRYFFSGTSEGSLDAQGRIALPPVYRQFALLEKDVVIIGNENHIEIWSADEWENEQQNMSSEGVTDDLIECGF